MTDGVRAELDALSAELLATEFVDGFSLTIARERDIWYTRGFGTRANAVPDALDANTVFPIGSITKQFTAAAVQRLALDGELSIDAPVAAYLSDAPHAHAIRLRDLLVQTSGLANYTAHPAYLETVAESTTVTPRELAALVADAPLAFAPGTRFAYSNTNYLLLGMILEAVTGKPYADVIEERVARPLELATLTFGVPAGVRNAVRTPWSPQSTYAAGGLAAAPVDLVRWNAALFNGTFFPPAVITEMTTPPALRNEPSAYAFGWVADTLDGRRRYWHTGGVLGAHTINCWLPDDHLTVVVFGTPLEFEPNHVVRAALRIVNPPSAAIHTAEGASPAGEDRAMTRRARREYDAWASGEVALSSYDDRMRALLTPSVMSAVRQFLVANGEPRAFVFAGRSEAAGSIVLRYRVETKRAAVLMIIAFEGSGKICGLTFKPAG